MQRLTHVIEMFDGEVTSIRTFAPDDITNVHDLFREIVKKNTGFSDEKIKEILETDKIFYSELYRVQVVSGTWGV